jgi:hypothetical protein
MRLLSRVYEAARSDPADDARHARLRFIGLVDAQGAMQLGNAGDHVHTAEAGIITGRASIDAVPGRRLAVGNRGQ